MFIRARFFRINTVQSSDTMKQPKDCTTNMMAVNAGMLMWRLNPLASVAMFNGTNSDLGESRPLLNNTSTTAIPKITGATNHMHHRSASSV
ncbi:MAG: hypothetical protein R2813_10665 [Flavobacteriales bacterium]